MPYKLCQVLRTTTIFRVLLEIATFNVTIHERQSDYFRNYTILNILTFDMKISIIITVLGLYIKRVACDLNYLNDLILNNISVVCLSLIRPFPLRS